MKKAISFFLTCLILFNTLGYYGIFLGLQYRNTSEMQRNFDDESYDLSKVTVIKIPITIPYGVDSRSFERVDGTFQHNGEFYRLIKQTFQKDTLQIVCIKDERNQQIHEAFVRFTETLNDQQPQSSGHSKNIDFIKDYLSITTTICSACEGWQVTMKMKHVSAKVMKPNNFQMFPPPRKA